jgi:hypothetical protein
MQHRSEGSRLGTAEDDQCGVETGRVLVAAEFERL